MAAVGALHGVWRKMPSGWFFDISPGFILYAMTMSGNAYWWVSRNGKTIIEGPAASIDTAKMEAEREAHILSRV